MTEQQIADGLQWLLLLIGFLSFLVVGGALYHLTPYMQRRRYWRAWRAARAAWQELTRG